MATGDRYEGEWSDGKKNGNGIECLIQVFTCLRTETNTKAVFRQATDKDRVPTPGATSLFIRDSGSVTG